MNLQANPKGRFDILAYRIAERIAKQFEAETGAVAVWPTLEPHVAKLCTALEPQNLKSTFGRLLCR